MRKRDKPVKINRIANVGRPHNLIKTSGFGSCNFTLGRNKFRDFISRSVFGTRDVTYRYKPNQIFNCNPFWSIEEEKIEFPWGCVWKSALNCSIFHTFLRKHMISLNWFNHQTVQGQSKVIRIELCEPEIPRLVQRSGATVKYREATLYYKNKGSIMITHDNSSAVSLATSSMVTSSS